MNVASTSATITAVPPISTARGGHRGGGRLGGVVVGDIGVDLLTPAAVDHQPVADAERQAGHRGQRQRDRIDVHDLAQQRHRAEPGQRGDRAQAGQAGGDHRSAQQQQEQDEQDRDGQQRAAARGVHGLLLEGAVEGRLAGHRRVHRCADGAVDQAFDLLLVGVDHLALGARHGRDDHRLRRARAQRGGGVASVPGRQHAGVGTSGQCAHERRPLAVDLRPRAFQQDRHEHAGAELGVDEMLRARGVGAGHDHDRRRQRARHAHARDDQRRGDDAAENKRPHWVAHG
jgi:hypothetical protein